MNQTTRQRPIPFVVENEAAFEFLIGMASVLSTGDTKRQLDELQTQLERLKQQSQSLNLNPIAPRASSISASASPQRFGRTVSDARGASAPPVQNQREMTNLVGKIVVLKEQATRDLEDLKLVESALRRFQQSLVGVGKQAAFVSQWSAAKRAPINQRVNVLLLNLPAQCRSKVQLVEDASRLSKWPP